MYIPGYLERFCLSKEKEEKKVVFLTLLHVLEWSAAMD